MVVKIGGAVGTETGALLDDLRNHSDYILIHGGSHEMNRVSEALGRPPRFVTSVSGHVSRYTDRETLSIIEMVYAGRVNKGIVEGMRRRGINAIGLTGLDGGLLVGKRKDAIRIVENGKVKILRNDHTGRVESVNTDLLKMLMSAGYVPVITIPISARDGTALNADADRIAAAVAASMGAEVLVILSNVPGLLRDPEDPSSLIGEIPKNRIEEYMEYAQGRMRKKVLGAREAVKGGVPKVVVASANAESPLTSALSGEGTVIC